MKLGDVTIKTVGILFLIIGIVDTIYSSISVSTDLILWFCYISLIVLGIASLLKRGYLVGVQICILAIPSFVWNIDYLYRLIFSKELFGFTNYMFEGAINLGRILSLQHFLTVPLAILVLYLIKSKRMDFWKLGLLEIIIFFFLTLILTNPIYNVNWVFREEFGIGLGSGLPYFFIWYFLFFLIIGVTNYLLYILKIFKKN